ncbi:MAG: hypothetical protein EZS28_019768 [Streblomastix strix]|uniref:Uncharacterized protein n=1 Tax=Streblomastix strix TaxID=222440 RepID=A0A5J4VQE2_9EUKA|nr:MAG: hypothetical protein EZS28_019768 [Streblomastix strix]
MDGDLHMLDVVLNHDQILYGSVRYNTIGLVQQVKDIENQISIINEAPAVDLSEYYTKSEVDGLISDAAIGDVDLSNYYNKTETDEKLELELNISDQIDAYTKTEADELLALKLNISDQIDAYTKTATDALLDYKLNVSDQIDAYTKQEDDALLLLKADKTELIDAYSKTEADELLALKLNISDQIDAYNKSETDALLDDKLNVSDQIDAYTKTVTDALLDYKLNVSDQIDAYTKTATDALLDDKLNVSDQIDAYTKTATDALLDDKLNVSDQINAYTKTQDDALLALKADKTELADYVDLQSAQTINGTKQFGNVSVASISKLNKNDASILLAGGGDMLVSSLVSQPQLQEVRDIASGRSRGYVFDTLQDLNDWMAVPDNVANLVIGDNLYIIDSQITDYWWDGTQLRELETQQPDLSNVVSSLGTATGGGNAITDLSLTGNILIPAKNKSFVDIDTDQSITGQKSFTTTIHSVSITYQDYDNSNVILAGGGVRAISDINASVDLTDYYNKSKIDEMINDANQLINDANELIRAVEDQIPPPATISNFVQKTGEELDQTIQGRIRQQLDERVPFDSMSDNLYITKFDALEGLVTSETFNDQLLEKADKTELNDYMTLGTAQTINANKTFNNACRFTSTIDGMSSITGASFIKSGGTDQQILLANGTTKPLSDFSNSIDISNFVDKSTDQTIGGNKVFSLEIRAPTFKLPGYSSDYVVMSGAMKNKSHFVLTDEVDQTVAGTKIFSNNITAPAFIKSDGTDQQVLLANGTTKPLSEFSSGSVDDSNYVKKTGQQYQQVQGNLRRSGSANSIGTYDYMTLGDIRDNTGSFGSEFILRNGQLTQSIDGKLTQQLDDYQSYENIEDYQYITKGNALDGLVQLDGQTVQIISGVLRKGHDTEEEEESESEDYDYCTRGYVGSQVNNTAQSLSNRINGCVQKTGFQSQVITGTLKRSDTPESDLSSFDYPTAHYVNNQAISLISSRLLDAAGLSDFPELYAYIKERYPKPLEQQPQPVPIGDQTLQQQVKNNDDIINNSNEEFEPPVPNAVTKLDLSSQLEITLTASYATTGVFPNGYLFKSYPAEARPKQGDQVIALVGTDSPNTYGVFCYIDQGGPFIISSRWLPSNTALVLNITYYKNYESSKKINYDANNDGKIDIMDTWNVNGKGQFEAQSYVYETVKKQTDLIEAGVQGLNRTNYLNSEIKLMDELAIYKADRAAYFIKDGPFIIYSFGAKLAQLGANSDAHQTVFKLFSTISKKLLPSNTKYMPIHVEQQEFSAMSLFKDIYEKSSAVQVVVSGQLNTLDCEFQGTYILDNYNNDTNNEASNEEPDSFIDEVIIKHDKQIGSSPQPQYTITNVFNQFIINEVFKLYTPAYNTFYIVDDGTCRVCVFNLYFESKGMSGFRTEEVGRIPDAVVPADGKKPQELIPTDSNDPQSRNELATSKPLPIVQPIGPSAPSIGLANGFMNGLQTLSLTHQRPFPAF